GRPARRADAARPALAPGSDASQARQRGTPGAAARRVDVARPRARPHRDERPLRDRPGLPRVGRGETTQPAGQMRATHPTAIWIAAGALGGAGAAVAIVIARGGGTSAVAPRTTASVEASLDPGAVEFGDPVTAKVSVLADRRSAGTGDIVVHQNLFPLTPLG